MIHTFWSQKIFVIRTHPEELRVLKCISSTHISTNFSQQWGQQMLNKCYPTSKGMFLWLSNTTSMTFGRSKTLSNILIWCLIALDEINNLCDFLDFVEKLWIHPQTHKIILSQVIRIMSLEHFKIISNICIGPVLTHNKIIILCVCIQDKNV